MLRTCPYCFSPLSRSARCVNTACDRAHTPGEDVRERLPERLRVRASALCPPPAPCPDCGAPSSPVCRGCGRALPPMLTGIPLKALALCGAPGAGKSTLMGQSLLTLQADARLRLTPMDIADTGERFHDLYASPLNEAGVPAAPTAPGAPSPFLYALAAPRDQCLALSVYDFPGETFSSHAAMEGASAALRACEGLILCVDPTRAPHVNRLLRARGAAVPPPDPGAFAFAERLLDEILVTKLPGRRAPLSVALALTHMDLWLPLAQPYPGADGQYDEGGMRARDLILRACMSAWDGARLLTRLSEFARFRVFGTGMLFADGRARFSLGADEPVRWLIERFGMRL